MLSYSHAYHREHLESTKEMTTDSFLNALRRFICRRGPVRSITSDNGSNFIGAQAELKQCFTEMDHGKIKKMLLEKNCDWITWEHNPPRASHMGGVWERMIRSVRSILNNLLKDCPRSLDDEMLNTCLCEAELLVNSAPITSSCADNNTIEPLSPINLLTSKSKLMLSPPVVFQSADMYCRRRWRFNTLPINFGRNGKRSTCYHCKSGRNGRIQNETSVLVTSF